MLNVLVTPSLQMSVAFALVARGDRDSSGHKSLPSVVLGDGNARLCSTGAYMSNSLRILDTDPLKTDMTSPNDVLSLACA